MKLVEFRQSMPPGITGDPIYIVPAYVTAVSPGFTHDETAMITLVGGRYFEVAGSVEDAVQRLSGPIAPRDR